MSFKATFSPPQTFKAVFGSDEELDAEFGSYILIPVADYYDGPYELTPSAEEQTIPIIGKTARQNITVNPIPSNYGLITWDGSTLTVS